MSHFEFSYLKILIFLKIKQFWKIFLMSLYRLSLTFCVWPNTQRVIRSVFPVDDELAEYLYLDNFVFIDMHGYIFLNSKGFVHKNTTNFFSISHFLSFCFLYMYEEFNIDANISEFFVWNIASIALNFMTLL